MNIRIAICEDELTDIDKLKIYLKDVSFKYPYYRLKIDVYRSGNYLIKHYERTVNEFYDIIFLDIDMGDSNGIETAFRLREVDRRALLIYVTSHNFIRDAAKTDMFRYLEKPFSQEEFDDVFKHAIKTLNIREKSFAYTQKHGHYQVLARNIIYFERVGLKTQMHMTSGKLLTLSAKIRDIIKDLENYGFVLIHKTFIINLAYVRGVQFTHLTLLDGTKFPVSRHHATNVKQKFINYTNDKEDVKI